MIKKKLLVALVVALAPLGQAEAVSTKYTNACTPLAQETGKYPEKKVRGYPLESIFKKMTLANQLMSEGQKVEALALINEVKNSTDDKFTLSVVYQYLARDAYEKDDFALAVKHAEKVVELDALPVSAILQMKKQVAWAYLGNDDVKSAINWMKQYFAQVINPPVSDYKALAQLYYMDKDFTSAICPLNFALNKTTDKKDKEALYKMLFGSHYTLNDLDGSIKILSEMVGHYPEKKQYWNQLFSIYYQKGDQQSSLAVSELAFQQGLWTKESEVINLASMHSNLGSPLRGAETLEKGIASGVVTKTEKNLKMLARFLDSAKEREKAIDAYKDLSSISKQGTYDYRVGVIYFETEDYRDAIKHFQAAVRKGGLKEVERGNAYLQMGAAQFYIGNENAAINALNRAKDVARVRSNATSWVAFIKEKQRIRELLRQDAEALEAEVAAEKAEFEET